jgi:hypothetical protein
MDQEYERKMLAYAEVEAWRHAREASLLNEGVPIAQVSFRRGWCVCVCESNGFG